METFGRENISLFSRAPKIGAPEQTAYDSNDSITGIEPGSRKLDSYGGKQTIGGIFLTGGNRPCTSGTIIKEE
jgi:hypothetical protein